MSQLPPELIEQNVESWARVVTTYDVTLSHAGWEHVRPLRDFAERFLNSEKAAMFRGGRSLDHLLISTSVKHLEDGERFVALHAEDTGRVHVEYWVDGGDAPLDSAECDERHLDTVVARVLERLWSETRGASRT